MLSGVLAFLGKLFTGKSEKNQYDVNKSNCPQEIKALIDETEANGKVHKAIDLVNKQEANK